MNDKMTIDLGMAKKLYPNAPDDVKEKFIKEFGANIFKSVTERVKTFSDACLEIGTSEKEFNERFNKLGLDMDTIFYEKVKIIVKALNEGWTPDWNDDNERKWYPFFNLSSGFGFRGSLYHYTFTFSSVSSRLCFKSEELSQYAGKQFIEIYEGLLK